MMHDSDPAVAAPIGQPSKLPQAALGVVILIILLAAVWLRTAQIGTHFTHVDDIGVAATILEARRDIASIGDLRAVIHNPKLRQYDSLKLRALRRLDGNGLLAPAFTGLSFARDMLAVPLRWSYAPGQYLITPWLISSDASYRHTLVAGRAPSAIFSILAIATAAFCAWRMRRTEDQLAPAFALAVMAMSLELFVFSVHMSNYAAGVLAASLLMIVLSRDRANARPIRSGLALAAMLWLLVHLSYQVLFLIPAAFIALAIAAMRRDGLFDLLPATGMLVRRLIQMPTIRMLVIAGIALGLALIPSYFLFMTSIRPITWNAGPNNEFVFSWTTGGSFVGFLVYALNFTLSNVWQTFAAMTSPVPEASSLYWPIAGVFLALFITGLISLLRKPPAQPSFVIGLFILLAFATSLAMAYAGLTALSPTRHALIFLPLYAAGIGQGAALALRRIRNPASRLWTATAALAAMLFIASLHLPAELERRHDPSDERAVLALLDSYGSQTVVEYGYTYNVDLMPAVRSRVALYNDQNLNFPWFGGRLPQPHQPVLFVSHRQALTAEVLEDLENRINATLPTAERWKFCFGPKTILYRNERPSAQTFEVSNGADSGQNGYFAYVITPSPAGSGC